MVNPTAQAPVALLALTAVSPHSRRSGRLHARPLTAVKRQACPQVYTKAQPQRVLALGSPVSTAPGPSAIR